MSMPTNLALFKGLQGCYSEIELRAGTSKHRTLPGKRLK